MLICVYVIYVVLSICIYIYIYYILYNDLMVGIVGGYWVEGLLTVVHNDIMTYGMVHWVSDHFIIKQIKEGIEDETYRHG